MGREGEEARRGVTSAPRLGWLWLLDQLASHVTAGVHELSISGFTNVFMYVSYDLIFLRTGTLLTMIQVDGAGLSAMLRPGPSAH